MTTTFNDLGLDPRLLEALAATGYTTPTPIQEQAIPSVRDGKDLLGIAQTGTGKTAAFALPILHRLLTDPKPPVRRGARVLVLSPTRELATQIAESFSTYGTKTPLTVGVVFGGVAHRPQAKMLQSGLDILVATPGRLLDHVAERNIELGQTEILVLDEADQMMDLGFIRPLRQIVSRLSAKRQSLFFSATMPHEIGALAAELLRDPVRVAVTPVAKTADRVAQRVIHVEANRKRAMLSELFADQSLSRVLVFTRTKRGADKVARHLEGAGVEAAAIHGNKSQAQRERALGDFKVSKIRALVATDIAARGIDVDQVSHVINFELPNIPESYVHRIGRTARAGAEGIAISLCDGEERAYLKDIERLTRQQIPSEDRRGCKVLEGIAAADPAPQRAERSDREDGDRREGRGRPRGGFGDRNGASRPPRKEHRKGQRRPEAGFQPRNESVESVTVTAEAGERPRREFRPERDDRQGEKREFRRGERSEFRGPRPDRDGARNNGERRHSAPRGERRDGDRDRSENRGEFRSGPRKEGRSDFRRNDNGSRKEFNGERREFNGERKEFSGERREPRRDHGDRPHGHHRSENRDRPDGGFRGPRRDGERRDHRHRDRDAAAPATGGDMKSVAFMGARPPRGEGRPQGDRPHRNGGDRPHRAGGDRPHRGGGDRPHRSGGDRPHRAEGDRPRGNGHGGQRHGQGQGNGPRRDGERRREGQGKRHFD